jgi:hypothetical protein
MSRTGNPAEHALAERFIKTLQYEASDGCENSDLPEARARIGKVIEEVYHEKRFPSALGCDRQPSLSGGSFFDMVPH